MGCIIQQIQMLSLEIKHTGLWYTDLQSSGKAVGHKHSPLVWQNKGILGIKQNKQESSKKKNRQMFYFVFPQ